MDLVAQVSKRRRGNCDDLQASNSQYEEPNSIKIKPENSQVYLWRAVIYRAIQDSIGVNMTSRDIGNVDFIISEARFLLSKPTKWLYFICEQADLDMNYLLKICNQLWNSDDRHSV